MAVKLTFWLTPRGLAALGLIAAATYFLLMEHRAHVIQFLPYLILLLCPLMHVFMHRNHGGHGGQLDGHRPPETDKAYRRGLEEGRKASRSDHHWDQ